MDITEKKEQSTALENVNLGKSSRLLEKSLKKVLDINLTELEKALLFLYQSIYTNNLIIDFDIKPAEKEKLISIARIIQYFLDLKYKWPASISSVEMAVKYAKNLCAIDRETFIAIYLDTHHTVLFSSVISYGTIDYAYVNIRMIFNYALKYEASKIILVHNHPSGDPSPSEEDISFTEKINSFAKEFGIMLLDHIIIANTYYSFKGEGLL